jgi:hypothetical protein
MHVCYVCVFPQPCSNGTASNNCHDGTESADLMNWTPSTSAAAQSRSGGCSSVDRNGGGGGVGGGGGAHAVADTLHMPLPPPRAAVETVLRLYWVRAHMAEHQEQVRAYVIACTPDA